MKIAFSTLGCPDFDWPDIYSMAKDLGFDGIEMRGLGDDLFAVNARPFRADQIDKTIALLARMHLTIPCLSSGCVLKDTENWPATREEIGDYIRLAARLGSSYIRLLADRNADREGEVDDEVVLAHLKEVLPLAEEKGVMLLLETNGVYADTARLRDLLNLRPQNYDLELETASVTERTVTNWTSSLTLNIGTDHGVEVNDCVIDETYALVGVVSEVGLNWCTVLTIVDTDTSLGAQVFRTKDLGLAVGDFSLMRENRLRLDYLPADCQLLGGDLVVTSGLGGYYPSGLSVGTVEEVQLSDSGAASYAVLEPAADFDSLVEVFVIKSFDIQT